MSFGRLEYEKRVNRVIDHIREHLADELKLADLARVAAFSPFHFHRLFTAIVGETPFAFIQRVRIERAAIALRDHREESVLAVALDHGFSSAAAFARAFRARYDDPNITAAEQCRYDACVVVPQSFKPDRWVNVMDVPGGKYAVSDFVGTAHEIVGAWAELYRSWLPGSGFQPDDRACFEIYRGNPSVDPARRVFRCELCIPVRPL